MSCIVPSNFLRCLPAKAGRVVEVQGVLDQFNREAVGGCREAMPLDDDDQGPSVSAIH